MDVVMDAVWKFIYAMLRVAAAVWSMVFIFLVFATAGYALYFFARTIVRFGAAAVRWVVDSKQHKSNSARVEEGGEVYDDKRPEALEKLSGERDGREGPG